MSELSFCSGGAGEHSADDAEFAKAVGVRLRKHPQTSHVLAHFMVVDPARFTHTRDYFGPAGGGSSEAGSGLKLSWRCVHSAAAEVVKAQSGAAQGPPKKASATHHFMDMRLAAS